MGENDNGRRSREQAPEISGAELAPGTAAWVEELLGHMGLEVSVSAEIDEEDARINITGPDARLCLDGLGQAHGQLLSNLQTVVGGYLQQQGWRGRNVTADAMNFRQRRIDALGEVATWLGKKVAQGGKPITILGMSSFDRRIIHTELARNRKVTTQSEGYGAMRRLKIQ